MNPDALPPALLLEAIRRRRQSPDPEKQRASIMAKLNAAIAGELPPADPATFTAAQMELAAKLARLAESR